MENVFPNSHSCQLSFMHSFCQIFDNINVLVHLQSAIASAKSILWCFPDRFLTKTDKFFFSVAHLKEQCFNFVFENTVEVVFVEEYVNLLNVALLNARA